MRTAVFGRFPTSRPAGRGAAPRAVLAETVTREHERAVFTRFARQTGGFCCHRHVDVGRHVNVVRDVFAFGRENIAFFMCARPFLGVFQHLGRGGAARAVFAETLTRQPKRAVFTSLPAAKSPHPFWGVVPAVFGAFDVLAAAVGSAFLTWDLAMEWRRGGNLVCDGHPPWQHEHAVLAVVAASFGQPSHGTRRETRGGYEQECSGLAWRRDSFLLGM